MVLHQVAKARRKVVPLEAGIDEVLNDHSQELMCILLSLLLKVVVSGPHSIKVLNKDERIGLLLS